METIAISCPQCKHTMEYWTRNNFINCTKCKASIPVEPCVDKVEMVIDIDYLVNNDIVFIDEVRDENDDYWLAYYEDEECTIRIDDIDQFIEDYKSKIETIEVNI